jgi:hypothetical protein
MNPLSRNPFELTDRAGLWLAAKLIAGAYRNFGSNPVAMRHAPSGAYVASGLAIVAFDPSKITLLLIIAMYAAFSYLLIEPDLPDMRAEWTADLYRKYGAKALRNRELLVARSLVLATVLTLIILSMRPASIGLPQEPNSITDALNILMLLSFLFTYWTKAAELPEPDHGDPYAKPHAA